MLKKDIQVNGRYRAKVNGKLTVVKVLAIRKSHTQASAPFRRATTIYQVRNETTGRETTFRSAARFHGEVGETTLPADRRPRKPDTRRVGDYGRGKAGRPPHVIAIARAGTGKTTTMVEGIKVARGLTSSILPSPQQQAIWDQIALTPADARVAFVAFNKGIATELGNRLPDGCDAMTLHSLGFRIVQAQFGRLGVNQYRVRELIAELRGMDSRELERNEPVYVAGVEKLVGLCKLNLITSATFDQLDELAGYYDIDLNGERTRVYEMIPRVLERCLDVTRDKTVDFNDMVWLPVRLQLPPSTRYDLLLVDEAQDLNKCQQALARHVGRRLILCGDPAQAIYGFAGADCDSIDRLIDQLKETPEGCVVLPLTVTRRCGKAIVAEARKYVPDFEAHDSNSPGAVSRAQFKAEEEGCDTLARDYTALVNDGDMILSRVNAPLVSQCFRFLKQGRKATIQGRDVAQGMISLIKRLAGKKEGRNQQVTHLLAQLGVWYDRERAREEAKKRPSESRLITLGDRFDCLTVFCEEAETVDAVIAKIESVFTDNRSNPGIRLSSIHKAKGLEADRVFFINTEEAPCPHPMAKSAWSRKQEDNLCYVAITRAISELVYVT